MTILGGMDCPDCKNDLHIANRNYEDQKDWSLFCPDCAKDLGKGTYWLHYGGKTPEEGYKIAAAHFGWDEDVEQNES